jgi:hypothetical protein
MALSTKIALILFLLITKASSLEILCGSKLRNISKTDKLIYVSLNCAPCTKYITKANEEDELPLLIFKENEPSEIKSYLLRHHFKNVSCIINKELKKCLNGEQTPQLLLLNNCKGAIFHE